jgi:hypothetical protein
MHFTELIDPACVADVFAEGIAEIEEASTGCIRITLFATRSLAHGERERVVVARLVLPEPVFARCLRQCAAFAAGDIAIDEEAPIEGARH